MKTWRDFEIEDKEYFAEYMKTSEAFQNGKMTAADWKSWYNERLAKILKHTTTKSEFYSRHFKDIDIDSISVDNLQVLPFTTKQHLRDEMYSMLCGSVRDAQFFYATTGTTGPSTPCPRSKKDIFTNNVQISWALKNIFKENFEEDYKPIVAVLAPNELHSICTTFSEICSDLGVCKLDPYPASPVIGFEKCIKIIEELQVDVIIGTPGLVLILAQIAEMYGIDCKDDLNIKVILSTGEICTSAMEDNIKSIYDAEVYNFIYASQEALAMSMASPDNKYFLMKPNYIFEVIDPVTDESLGLTGKGDLCVTMLTDGIKPLIRYRTGDFVNIYEDESRPEPYSTCMQLLGRTKDLVKINENFFSAYDIEQAIMESVKDCVGYQVVINNDDKEDIITVKLQFMHNSDIDKNHLRGYICENAEGVLCAKVNVEYVLQLDDIVNTGAWISWKAARIVDERDRPDEIENEYADLENTKARELSDIVNPLILDS